jgi:4-hydroxybenzoate polyprenyltransferase
MAYLQLLRPPQWIKNLFLFAGLIFSQHASDWRFVLVVVAAFVCFCLISSAVYVFNDLVDRKEDRIHPTKRNRPIASGRVGVGAAAVLALVLVVLGLLGGFELDRLSMALGLTVRPGPGRVFFVVEMVYLLLQIGYTLGLKKLAILDVIIIGAGFVLRAVAGAVVIAVQISPWLVLCTFTLCLFMGFSKRRCELNVLASNGGDDHVRHRRSLAEYTPELLNHMTTLTAGIAVVSFMLYATDASTSVKFFGEPGVYWLAYTLPLVVYAIFRFALLVEHGRVDGPTAVVLRDRPFQAAILLWVVAVMVVVYRGRELQGWLTEVLQRSA